VKADGIFEGGGVKGIGLAGALCYAEEEMNVRWQNLGGTSSGALIAALLASGYTSGEIKAILFELDFVKIKDRGFLDRFSFVGKTLSLLMEKGIYEGDFIRDFFRDILAEKGVKTFGDLLVPGETDPRYKYRLNVIASDISRGKMLVLPQDIRDYGCNPDKLEVATALRMSISIPLFFEPVELKSQGGQFEKPSCIVDGGILSNYPVWLYDSPDSPCWPTLGFRLVEPNEGGANDTTGLVSFLAATVATMMEAHDARHIQEANFQRTIAIPTLGIKTTDFKISKDKKEALFNSGYQAARDFFRQFSGEKYRSLHPFFAGRPNIRREDLSNREI
jgi:NTE family protein